MIFESPDIDQSTRKNGQNGTIYTTFKPKNNFKLLPWSHLQIEMLPMSPGPF